MSLIALRSENPDFSYVLQKNPVTTPLVVKPLKEGTLFGFYSKFDPKTFIIYFRDGDDEVSFKAHPDDEFEYLNPTRYNSSMFIFNAIKELLGHIENNKYKESQKDVSGFKNTVVINMVHVGIPKYLEFFSSMPGIQLSYEQLIGHEYRLIITTERSIHDLMNYVSLLSIFLVMINDNEYLFVEEGLIDRFIKVMNNLDVDYYIKYLFKLKFMSEKPSFFKKYKSILEESKRQKIQLFSGDTHEQRIDFVMSKLKFDCNIVDLGSGEGRYTIPLSKKVETVFAIDTDEEVRNGLKNKLKRKAVENVIILPSLDSYLEAQDSSVVDVVCSEVIEHIEFEKVEDFLKNLFKIEGARTVIITTPNRDFNKNYRLEGFRHTDHKFEMTEIDFKNYVMDFVSKYSIHKTFKFEFHNVGDGVDGIHVSQAVIFTRI